eukprot:354630_1
MSWECLQQKLKSARRSTTSRSDYHSQLQIEPPSTVTNSNHPLRMLDLVFWMCLFDGLYAIQIICNWFPLAFNLPFWTTNQCHIFGMSLQFLSIQSPCWHVLMAYNLGYLFLDGSIKQLAKQKKYQFILVMIIPLIC